MTFTNEELFVYHVLSVDTIPQCDSFLLMIGYFPGDIWTSLHTEHHTSDMINCIQSEALGNFSAVTGKVMSRPKDEPMTLPLFLLMGPDINTEKMFFHRHGHYMKSDRVLSRAIDIDIYG
jgi:hypothetical protein